ncbi:hypothetical protein BN2537_11317 [Streptomyces venezuelae]|nr:hypothetical protein BN2537_11317 [Streptomyces venezuelae]
MARRNSTDPPMCHCHAAHGNAPERPWRLLLSAHHRQHGRTEE